MVAAPACLIDEREVAPMTASESKVTGLMILVKFVQDCFFFGVGRGLPLIGPVEPGVLRLALLRQQAMCQIILTESDLTVRHL